MNAIRWLHLSDFHQGMAGQRLLWPNVREVFYEDLERLHRRCGPWDLVLFTGDLTQRGSREEFDQFDETLSQLFAHLRSLDSDPVLLTVPGNHDLIRPGRRTQHVKALETWSEDHAGRQRFWNETGGSRRVIQTAFQPYETWWRETRLPRPSVWRAGLLPGDFSATVEKNGIRLGILGLNTAFLQLTAGDYHGRLAVGLEQFHAACEGHDGPAWARSHDVCLLLTHHPPAWLDPSSRSVLQGEIAPPKRFLAHLFGHMHEGHARQVAENGSAPRRDLQSPSLFGLEGWGSEKETRQHGYIAGQLERSGEKGLLRLWPRIASRRADSSWRLDRDPAFDLEDDHGTRAEEVALHPRPPRVAPPSGSREDVDRPASPPSPARLLTKGIDELPNALAHHIQGFLTHYVGQGEDTGRPFGGRTQALAELDQWLAEKTAPPYRLLLAPGGRGKSALLAHWVCQLTRRDELDVVYFPVSVRFQTNLKGQLFQAVVARLAGLRGEPIPRDLHAPVEVSRRAFMDALHRPPAPGRRVLVVIDGLDELADADWGPSLFPAAPSPGLRLVLCSRERVDRDWEGWRRELGWTRPGLAESFSLNALDGQGLTEVLKAAGPRLQPLANQPAVIAELWRLSQGDPLLLGLYLDELSHEASIDPVSEKAVEKLRSLQPGLEGFFKGWWEDQRKLWGSEAPTRQREVSHLLGALAWAMGPLSRDDLTALLRLDSGLLLDDVLQPAARLLVGDGQRQGIVFTHPRLATHFQTLLGGDERRRWSTRFLDWGRQALAELESGRRKPEEVSAYLLRYHGAHLEREAVGAESFLPLVSESWLRAVESRERTHTGFLTDVERARNALHRENRARLAQGRSPALAEEVRCGVVHSSLRSLAQNLSPPQLRAFLALEWWTLEEAFSYARNIPDGARRLEALLTLVDGASPPRSEDYLREAVQVAIALDRGSPWDGRHWEEVGSRVSASLLPTFLEEVRRLESAHLMDVLLEVARHQPPPERRLLLERVRGLVEELQDSSQQEQWYEKLAFMESWERERESWAQFPLGPTLDSLPADTPAALRRLAERPLVQSRDPEEEDEEELILSQAWERPELRTLEPELRDWLDEPRLKRLLEHTRQFSRMKARACLLIKLAPRLTAQLMSEAWRIALELEDASLRADVLAALAPGVSKSEWPQAIEDLRKAVFAISDADQLLPVAAMLADLLPEPHRHSVMRSVWEARGAGQIRTQLQLIRFLQEEARRDALVEVLREKGKRADASLDWPTLLSYLGPALETPSIQEELRRLPLPKFSALSFTSREQLASFATDEQLLELGLEEPQHEDLPDRLVSFFRKVGPRLSLDLQRRVLDAARARNDVWRALMITGLAPHLDRSLLSEALQQVSLEKKVYGFWALAALWPRLPRQDHPALLQEAMTKASALKRTDHDHALQSLAGCLAETLGEETIDFVDQISMRGFQALFLVSLLPYLPRARERLIHEALERAVQDWEVFQARVVLDVVGQTPVGMELPLELVEYARRLQEDENRAAALQAVASHLPLEQRYPLLEEALRLAIPGGTKLLGEEPLSTLVSQLCELPREQLYRLWEQTLPRLAARPRPEFLQSLQVLGPVLLTLGGKEELARIVRMLLEVGRWWC